MEIKDLLGESYKDGMTMEELTTALKGIEMPKDQSAEIERLKNVISGANSEAKEWKDKYRSTLDEATKKAQETEEANAKLQERLAALEKEKTVSSYKASYLSMGYEEALAEETAKAIADGNMAKVFENQKKHQAAVEKRAKEDALKGSPRPGGTGGGGNDESDALKIAKQISAARAEADKTAKSGLEHYIK